MSEHLAARKATAQNNSINLAYLMCTVMCGAQADQSSEAPPDCIWQPMNRMCDDSVNPLGPCATPTHTHPLSHTHTPSPTPHPQSRKFES